MPLTAKVFDQNNAILGSATVSWSSSHPAVATVSSQGLVTAVTNGTATITARSGSASATAAVTVMQSAGRIVLEPSTATLMSLGETVQLVASVQDENGQPVSGAVVTWQSSDEAVATVSSQGLVTSVSNGTATITASSGNASSTATITVMQSAGRIVLEPSSATLVSLGETVQLTASVLDENGQAVDDAAVTWQSSDEDVAMVSSQGLVTAVTNGTATITARSGSASATAMVTVMQSAGRIVVEPSSATLMSLGETVQLVASVLDDNGRAVEDAAITWQSSDEAVATVSSQGLVTAVTNGTATITARSGSASSTAAVTVMQSAGRIVIEPSSATLMSLGETVQLTASVLDDNGQPVSGAVVSWQSSDEAVATVSSQGLVTADSNGTATITARSGSASATAAVTVMQSAGRIVFEPSTATLMSLGETVQLSASVFDANGQAVEDAAISWSSSDEGVATVSAQGLVTAVSNGTATITARSGSASAMATVTVMQSAGRIVVEPSSATLMSLGATVQLVASVLDDNGRAVEDAAITWQSSDEGVATVSSQGLVTAVSNGTATIKARSGGELATATVTVMDTSRDREVLIALYNSTDGPNWTNSTNWLSDMPLGEWFGVSTNTLGRVVRLELLDNALSGNIPPGLGSLSDLTYVSFYNNQLSGGIPPKLGNLSNLQLLELDNNQLSGNIPPELGNLSKLNTLRLPGNQLSGNIPPELGNLNNLTTLYLFNNTALYGPLPGSFTGLDNLQNLHLQGTGLCAPSDAAFQAWLRGIAYRSGLVNCDPDRDILIALYNATDGPNWTVSTNWLNNVPLDAWHGVTTNDKGEVTELELIENNLQNSIPPELGQLKKLERLVFAANPLTGSIPPAIGLLDSLTELILAGNQLTGSIPSELGQLRKLESLQLHVNQLTGDIPSELGQLGALTELYLFNNQLTGTIPPDLGQLRKLVTLALNDNPDLTGPLPIEMTRLTNLTGLLLDVTQLCAPQTPEFLAWLEAIGETAGSVALCPSSDRDVLIALYNSTNGPNWTNRTNWLSSAPIDAWYGVTTNDHGEVTVLELSHNNLQGVIPQALGQLSRPLWILIDGNRLTGSIPAELGQLGSLTRLELSNNQLAGSIPAELGQLSKLAGLELSNNQLTGSIPSELGQLSKLDYLYLDDNRLTGSIPSELGQLSKLAGLGLSNNQLTGSIPSEIGQLKELEDLALDRNTGLSGPLPVEMTNLLNLRRLSLDATGICIPQTAEILSWLREIQDISGFNTCSGPDRDILIALYHSTNGPSWTNRTNWLSNAPIGEWYGVGTNAQGELGSLSLEGNNLEGRIPSDIGQLRNLVHLNLGYNLLTGAIPPEIGQLQNLTQLYLGQNRLTGAIPPEIGQLQNLTQLLLEENQLTDTIPSEIGQLQKLQTLSLHNNLLTGVIPRAIGQLQNLIVLWLRSNQLSGSLPSELGQLSKLESLTLDHNSGFSGSLPVEMTRLAHLSELYFDTGICVPATDLFQIWFSRIPSRTAVTLKCEDREALIALYQSTNGPNWVNSSNWLSNEPLGTWHGVTTNTGGEVTGLSLTINNLHGHIPSKIGQLGNLTFLDLGHNQLTGSIPRALGQLTKLNAINLSYNQLTGSVPSKLGQLQNLVSLDLRNNPLTGQLPPGFGQLYYLFLSGTRMSGALPQVLLTNTNLSILEIANTRLCIPTDEDGVSFFRRMWSGTVAVDVTINDAACHRELGKSTAYLVQATQSNKNRGLLEAGKEALLRVFVTTVDRPIARIPPVRATFYQGDNEVYSIDIPEQSAAIQNFVLEHNLWASSNARVPGWVVQPGLEMVIDIDPDGLLDPAIRMDRRLPPTGRLAVSVVHMPPLRLTLVPFYWREDPGPDEALFDHIKQLSAEHRIFRFTRDLLPVGDFELRVLLPFWTSTKPVSENKSKMLRLTNQAAFYDNYRGGYYMGVLRDGGGAAKLGEAVFVSTLVNSTIAHEIGHAMNLRHAPCGDPKHVDPDYPYPDGSIGRSGYDFIEDMLVPPDTSDLMSYCGPPDWISRYHFIKAWSHRKGIHTRPVAAYSSPTTGLLLWGGVNDDGEIFLDPAFVINAPPVSPQKSGPYLLMGEDRNGGTLFRLSFSMAEIVDGEGGFFSFVLPTREDWSRRLSRITLSGPEGIATLEGQDNPSATLLLDRATGELRGILRDWPAPGVTAASARRTAPEPGLEVVISRGIPSAEDWER